MLKVDTPNEFYEALIQRQDQSFNIPASSIICRWADRLLNLLFPERGGNHYNTAEELTEEVDDLRVEISRFIVALVPEDGEDTLNPVAQFFEKLPDLYRILNTDIHAILNGDPAASSRFEVIRAYPGFYAIAFYRIAHSFHQYNIPVIPRILTEYAHSLTGIDIHPGAEIGEHFCIDHGTGLVIGETTIIGNRVKLYQGVTLGALSVAKYMAGSKRHPTIQDDVIIYSGATVLGGETVVGHHSVIGGNVWLVHSIEPYCRVYNTPSICIKNDERRK